MTLIPLLLTLAHAAPTLGIQGTLTDAGGQPVEGSRAPRFRVWSAGTGGTALHDEQVTVSFVGGAFATHLGLAVPLEASDYTGTDLWFSVHVTGLDESARVPLGSAPRALFAEQSGNAATATYYCAADRTNGPAISGNTCRYRRKWYWIR